MKKTKNKENPKTKALIAQQSQRISGIVVEEATTSLRFNIRSTGVASVRETPFKWSQLRNLDAEEATLTLQGLAEIFPTQATLILTFCK